jgi:hypothetical protein
MATLVGTNTVTSIARHYIMPTITDNVYASNVLLYRLMRANKRLVRGGTQIEAPLMYQRFNTGGSYRGYDVFNTTPSDTIKNAVWDWKQYYVTWAVDGLTMIKVDSPDAIANFLTLQSQQASMEMAENLAAGLFGDGLGTVAGTYNATSTKDIDGLAGIVGTGSTVGNANYGGISRTANTWWNSSVTGTSTADVALTQAGLLSAFTAATVGGQHPTLILSRTDQWNRFYALNTAGNYTMQYARQPMGHDELLASAGFTNLLFNNVPWVVDSHVGDGNQSTAGNSRIYMLNENVLNWVVSPRADFYLKPFVEPANQDAMVATILWAGNLICLNNKLQGGIFNIAS